MVLVWMWCKGEKLISLVLVVFSSRIVVTSPGQEAMSVILQIKHSQMVVIKPKPAFQCLSYITKIRDNRQHTSMC